MSEQECLYLKSLTLERIDTPSFKRIYITSQYRVPVTFTVVGQGGSIAGIAARVHSTELNQDSSGIFLLPGNCYEIVSQAEERRKKKKKVNFTIDDYKAKFALIDLLEKGGYENIAKNLIQQQRGSHPSITKMTLTNRFSAQMVPLEHFYNFN